MQDLKVVLVQTDQHWEAKKENLLNYNALLADTNRADLILLPEMFQTGFTMNASEMAENMDDSESLEWLIGLAAEKDSAVYTSMIVKDGNHYYNRGLFITPAGEIHVYDKRKTFGLAGEDKVFSNGNEEQIVSYRGWKFQLQICYDLRFPEIVRNRITSNAEPAYDVILYVANWPRTRSEHWRTLVRARAIENQCYVVGVNRIGEDAKGLSYSGDSVCVNALGEAEECLPDQTIVRTVILSKTVLEDIRKRLPFLRDR